MEIPCIYKYQTYMDGVSAYVCEFSEQNIPKDVQLKPDGLHLEGDDGMEKTNDDVIGVIFDECKLVKIPQGLTETFKNLRILSIWWSSLINVTKDDLAEYKNIERLGLCGNKIKYLPGDLLEGFDKLVEIGFNSNKLNIVEPNILNGLNELKYVNFSDNSKFNEIFSLVPGHSSTITLDGLKDLFAEEYVKYHKNKENGIEMELKNFFQTDENFKDLSININGRDFLVHKHILAARSPTLAEILKNNPEVENLNLVDIPEEIFEKILHFLYTDELPNEETNFMDLFAAAGKLKINMLMNFAAENLIETIQTENALNILSLSNKYEHEELKFAAFEKIQNDYSEIEFKDEWANDTDTVMKIIKAYRIKVAIMQKAEEDFEELLNGC